MLAVEGSFASVIGGAPAAAVVFTGEVDARTAADPRVRELERRLAGGRRGRARPAARPSWPTLRAAVRAEKLGEVAAEFDAVHSIERAVAVGSVDAIIAPARAAPAPHRGPRTRPRRLTRSSNWAPPQHTDPHRGLLASSQPIPL